MTLSAGRLARLLEAFDGRAVLVVGDLVADEYVYGETSRVSREAPVLILRHVGRRVIPGGAGNAVLNVAALGARAVPVGVLGAGETSERVLQELRAHGVEAGGVVQDASRVAIRKTRVMAGGPHGQKQQVLRIDHDDPTPLAEPVAAKVAALALERLPSCDAVLFSDYGYGTISDPLRSRLIEAAAKRGIPVCADSRHALRAFTGVTYATPNEEEAGAAWGSPIHGEADLKRAAHSLREALRAEFLLVTRGRDGMALAERDGGLVSLPVFGEAEAADTTGAGDTVAAASLLTLVAGGTPREAAQLATIAAGIVVQKHGAATTTREEIGRVAGVRPETAQAG
jgi:rfaE bifunctional protein kinase chain/domain